MIKKLLAVLVALAFTIMPVATLDAQQSVPQGYAQYSRGFGYFTATVYNQWKAIVVNGNLATGSQTIQVQYGQIALPDGSLVNPFNVNAPITIDFGANQETVTPSAVSGCNVGAGNPLPSLCNITATFANTHGQGAPVFSGSFGLQEAINDAFIKNGGTVVVDKAWGGTNATLTAAVPYPSVVIMDTRQGAPVYWNAQGGLTTLAAPTTLVNTTTVGITVNGANATSGFYTNAAAYFVCIAYVDVAGQEGPCSGTMSFTPASGTTNQIGFTAPAASPGAVGWVPYISLTSGSYVLAYKVPLVTQPTVVGALPLSNGVCTLTAVEFVTPACAVTNATYGQTGSGAVVSALTVSTSPIDPQVTTVSSTTVFTPNAGGRTTYTYVPAAHVGYYGFPGGFLPFTIAAAPATVVPTVLGTINLPPGIMNYVGRTLEICGYATTTATASTIEDISFQWDAFGQNTAGKGLVIGNLTGTTTLATTGHISFCADFMTTVASASATGGSINPLSGIGTISGVDLAATNTVMGNTLTGAVGSMNLAMEARINVIYLHTTATDGAGYTLQSLSAKVIN